MKQSITHSTIPALNRGAKTKPSFYTLPDCERQGRHKNPHTAYGGFGRRLLIPVLLLLLLLASVSYAKSSVLSIDEYRIEVLKVLPQLKLDSLSVRRAEESVTMSDSYDDPVFGAGIYDAGSVTMAGIPPVSTNAAARTGNVSIMQTTRHGGISWNMSANIADYSLIPGTASGLTVGMNIPLMKNRNGILNRFAVNDARLGLTAARLTAASNEKTLLLSWENSYYQWIYYIKSIMYLKTSVANAKTIAEESRKKWKDGLIDADYYYSAAAAVHKYEDRLIQSRHALKALFDNFRAAGLLIERRKPDQAQWKKQLKLIRRTSGNLPATAWKKTLSGYITGITEKRLKARKDMQQNAMLPALNIMAGTTFGAGSADMSGTLSDGQTEHRIGLEFMHVLGNRAAKSNLEDIDLQLQSLDIMKAKYKDEYGSRMKILKDQLTMILELTASKKAYVRALEKRHAAEKKKYDTGRMSLTDVISTRNLLVNEKMNLLALDLELLKAWTGIRIAGIKVSP